VETSTYPGTSAGASSVGEQVREGAQQVGDQVQQARETVQDTAQRAVGQAQEQVQQLSGKARSQLREQVDHRLTQTGRQVGSTAEDLRAVATELRRKEKESSAKVAEQIADRVEGMATYLNDADGQRVLRDVEDFGRRQPWAVLAGGLALGFVASRFLKASSGRRFEGETASGHTSIRSRDEIRAGLESRGVASRPVPPAPYAPQ
jgi:hypothetical protein